MALVTVSGAAARRDRFASWSVLIASTAVLFWSGSRLVNDPRIFRFLIDLLRIRPSSDLEKPIVAEIEVVVELVSNRQWKDAG